MRKRLSLYVVDSAFKTFVVAAFDIEGTIESAKVLVSQKVKEDSNWLSAYKIGTADTRYTVPQIIV